MKIHLITIIGLMLVLLVETNGLMRNNKDEISASINTTTTSTSVLPVLSTTSTNGSSSGNKNSSINNGE